MKFTGKQSAALSTRPGPDRAQTGKHRSASTAPRGGAAALMIGGLVAGTVATAGATTLANESPRDTATGDLSEAARNASDTLISKDAMDQAAALADLRSSSIDQLRTLTAADRSEARPAPENADSVETVLADSAFTGTTLEVEPAEPVQQQEPVQETTQATQAQATQAQITRAQATQAQATQAQTTGTTQQSASQTNATSGGQTSGSSNSGSSNSGSSSSGSSTAQQSAPAPAGGGLMSIAAQYVGYPYVLYGTPPNAFDCSSYTWYVYQQAGISIPRTVSGQEAAVTPVSNPQPGDLVFYGDFYHVGIYAGNGMTYEAMNPSTGVRYGKIISSNVWYGRIG